MKSFFCILFFSLIISVSTVSLYAQTDDSKTAVFKEGVVQLDSKSELNTLIKVEKWDLNPVQVTIKKPETSATETLTLEQIRSFTIPGEIKFIRDTVQIDISRDPNKSLSGQKEPTYNSRTVLLRVLVEGKASLYSYRAKDLFPHFYFKTPKTEISYLEYKTYMAKTGGYSYNNSFRVQLYSRLNCTNSNTATLLNPEYNTEDLTEFVASYNECAGGEVVRYGSTKRRDSNRLYLSAGVVSSNLNIFYSRISESPNLKLDYGATTHFSLHAGAEWILPVSLLGEWSILTGFSFQTFEANAQFKNGRYIDRNTNVQAKYLNLIAELRKYFSITQENAIFLSGAVGFSLNSTSKFQFYYGHYDQKFSNALIYQVSAGYMWNNLLFGKISYTPPFDTFNKIDVLESELSSLSISIGISL